MLLRACAALIVLFWLTMTTLLIRNEVQPGDSRWRELPMSHVLKLLFLHEQTSDLSIHYEKALVGRMRVYPHVRKSDDARVVEFGGNFQVSAPGVARQRLVWDGSVEMTPLFVVGRVRLGLNVREPSPYRIDVTLEPPEKKGRYELRAGDRLVEAREYSLDASGAQALLQQLEVSPEIVAMLQAARTPEPLQITARQSSFELEGGSIDTSLVTIRQNAQTLLEVHISQFGQVLRATTLLGYTLTRDELP